MRPSSFAVVAACVVLPAACNKKQEAKPVEKKAVTEVQVAPKQEVPQKQLPALAADPGGATGKPVWQAGFGGPAIDSAKAIVTPPIVW